MTLTVDELEFSLHRSRRRQSVEITVDRRGELKIAAPLDCPVEALEAFVREKKVWIYTKLLEKERRLGPPVVKEYVTGEGFPYLGKSYRLLLVERQDVPLKLEHGRFKLLRGLADDGRTHFVRWYTNHAHRWLNHRVDRFARRLGVEPHVVEVRDLGYRWGSCSPLARLNFHWRVVLLPPSIAEYVVVHELVHLVVPNHGPDFWRRIELILPDWIDRKTWLADHGTDWML